MPTYNYKCRKCELEFAVKQSINDDPLTECIIENENGEMCGGEVYRKISANVGLVFNGKGFYQTDYKSTSASPTESSCATGKCPIAS